MRISWFGYVQNEELQKGYQEEWKKYGWKEQDQQDDYRKNKMKRLH